MAAAWRRRRALPTLREREGDSSAHALCKMDKKKHQNPNKNKRFLIATDESAAKCQSKE